jgi:hypothetical protein
MNVCGLRKCSSLWFTDIYILIYGFSSQPVLTQFCNNGTEEKIARINLC